MSLRMPGAGSTAARLLRGQEHEERYLADKLGQPAGGGHDIARDIDHGPPVRPHSYGVRGCLLIQ